MLDIENKAQIHEATMDITDQIQKEKERYFYNACVTYGIDPDALMKADILNKQLICQIEELREWKEKYRWHDIGDLEIYIGCDGKCVPKKEYDGKSELPETFMNGTAANTSAIVLVMTEFYNLTNAVWYSYGAFQLNHDFAEKHNNFKIIAWKYIEPFGRYGVYDGKAD